MMLLCTSNIIKRHKTRILKYGVVFGIVIFLYSSTYKSDIRDPDRSPNSINTHNGLPIKTFANKPKLKLMKQNTSISDSEYTIQQRKENMANQCLTDQRSHSKLNVNHYVYNGKYNFLYCKVAKVGSTFWGRLIEQVIHNVVASPYKIKPQLGMILSLGREEKARISTILKDSTKFFFVRNPYSRVFSGYIDKIYSPNPVFWKGLGRYIVQKFRKGTQRGHCGHDVTFLEYFTYAIHSESTGLHEDMHSTSIRKLCSPCTAKFDIIGKMETFKDDTYYILDKLNLGNYKEALTNITEDATADSIYDIAQAFTAMRQEASRCISKEEVVQRIWRKLQISGHVSIDIPVPTAPLFEMDDMAVFRLFKDANAKSPRQTLKQQKHKLLMEAYQSIPLSILHKYAEVFRKDFELFGYDAYPTEIFQRSNDTREV